MPYPFLKRWMRVSALTKNRSAKRCRCECVALNRLASRSRDWLASLAAGADRLVHRSVSDEQARAHQRRLVVAALFVPLVMAAALVQALADQIGGVAIVALVSALIGAGWLAAILLAASGKARIAEFALLGLAMLSSAAVIAAAGLSSPLALLAALPLVECVWVRRDRAGLVAGLIASAAVLPLQAALSAMLASAPLLASAWHWLVPAAYLMVLAARARTFLAEREGQASARRPASVEDLIDAVVLRMSRAGEVLDASAKAQPLLGLQPGLLLGSGLFDRVHVADRVAYLCALSDLRAGATHAAARCQAAGAARVGRRERPEICEFRARTRRYRRSIRAGSGGAQGERRIGRRCAQHSPKRAKTPARSSLPRAGSSAW